MSFVERSRACPFGSIPPKELGEENAVSAQNRSSNKARGILKKDEKAKLKIKRKRKEGSYDYDNQQNQNPTPYNNMYLPLNI